LAEFVYNNTPSATTGVSPFFTNKGYHPNISIYPEHDMTSARARDYAVDLESLHQYLEKKWPMHNFATKVRLMPNALWHRTSK